MLSFVDKTVCFNFVFCQQCGACEAICPEDAIILKLRSDGLRKIEINNEKCIRCKKCVIVCPANKRNTGVADFKLFPFKKYFLGYNENEDIRCASSSGGVCKTLIVEGLKKGIIDGVYSLIQTEAFPYAEGAFYTKENLPNYDMIPNSIYHSVMTCRNIEQVQKCNRLMIVGTSCQLKALEKALKGKYNELIEVCIFCKQQKTLDSTRFIAKAMGTHISDNLKFSTRYRGNGWPGIVKVNGFELPWNRAAQIPFGKRLWTVPGCNVCGDSFGMECNADLTLMDPWIIREANNLGETLVVVHSQEGMNLVNNVPNLMVVPKTYEQIEKALGLEDIRRKQQLVSYFRGDKCTFRVKFAGRMERFQRWYLQALVTKLPKLPFIFYRVLCKLPDWRNLILK